MISEVDKSLIIPRMETIKTLPNCLIYLCIRITKYWIMKQKSLEWKVLSVPLIY